MEVRPVEVIANGVNDCPAEPVGVQGRRISTCILFAGGGNEIVIEHLGEQYRLSQTRNGKLILTK
jgi:hemin uptake protein HemP